VAVIYLIIDPGNRLVKVGFTADLSKRIHQYTTANPRAFIADHCRVQERSGRTLEKLAHSKMRQYGGIPVAAYMDGKRTEWFDYEPTNPVMFDRLRSEGLQALNLGHRKYLGHYTRER
jgi:hypothetical protein